MPYDAAVTTDDAPKGGWLGLIKVLSPFFVPPFIVLLPLVLAALIAFWIYVWISRDRRPSSP
jgi:hypothetical protein